MTGKVKLQGLILGGGAVWTPMLGVAVRSEGPPSAWEAAVSRGNLTEDFRVSVGPQAGIVWNTGNGVLSRLFLENELLWQLGDGLLLTYYLSVGVRLF